MRIGFKKHILLVSIMVLVLLLICKRQTFAQDAKEIFLYENTDKSGEQYRYNSNGAITHVSGKVTPRLMVYQPVNPNGTGIIICPGGGYAKMNVENTGFIAERLNRLGITAFVLVYRLPINDTTSIKSVATLQDVQQAFRLVRKEAAKWNLNLNKIGLWGSSAGGHLAAMAATHYKQAFKSGESTNNLRPDFLILAWPVVSFKEKYVHKGSMKNLLGDRPSENQIAFYSAEEWVNEDSPPTFLVHASDDKTVKVQNSILFYQGLQSSGVSTEMHLYQNGGHGFGIAPDVKDSWFSQLGLWLKKNDL